MVKEFLNSQNDLYLLRCDVCYSSSVRKNGEQRVPVLAAAWDKHGDNINKVIEEFKKRHKDCK